VVGDACASFDISRSERSIKLFAIVAWQWEAVGGVLLLMIGFLFLVVYPIREGGDAAIQVVVPMLLTMGLPPFVAGLLFLLS